MFFHATNVLRIFLSVISFENIHLCQINFFMWVLIVIFLETEICWPLWSFELKYIKSFCRFSIKICCTTVARNYHWTKSLFLTEYYFLEEAGFQYFYSIFKWRRTDYGKREGSLYSYQKMSGSHVSSLMKQLKSQKERRTKLSRHCFKSLSGSSIC